MSMEAALSDRETDKVRVGAIPEAMKELRRWVLWRKEYRDGKVTKVPYSAQLGGGEEGWPGARSNDPKTWATFPTVMKYLSHFDGLGFMLGGGISGCDLDNCRNPETGELKVWAQEIIGSLN